jgi:hypothetical protein
MHSYYFQKLPLSFAQLWQANIERNPERTLRNDDYFIPQHRIELVKKLPLYTFPAAWNSETEPVILNIYEARNRFQGMNSASLCRLTGRYDNPIPTRFLAPIDCLKIPALMKNPSGPSQLSIPSSL